MLKLSNKNNFFANKNINIYYRLVETYYNNYEKYNI